jgi:hypothetical protein
MAALLYCCVSALLCAPLLPVLNTQLPLGELGEPTVPFFNLWTLQWNAERAASGFSGYWDAPIFFPARDTFALSEPQGLTGLLYAPLAALSGPVAGYNLTLLLLLAANGLAGRRLLVACGAGRSLATWGGVLFVGLQFLREELGVLQLCATWPVVLTLSEIALLTRGAEPWAVVRLGLWIGATAWSCIYYLLFLAVLVALAAPFVLRRSWLERRMLGALLLGLLIAAAAVAPLLAAEREAVAAHTRSASSIHSGSGSALSYLMFPRGSVLAQLVPSWSRAVGRRSLYPGALLVALAVLGGVRHGRREHRRLVLYSLSALSVALLLSFGTRLHIAGLTPYELTAQRYLPGFGHLRSPYRAAAFVQLLLALWAGLGLVSLAQRVQARAPLWAAKLLPALCVTLALLEVTPWRFALAPFPDATLREPWIAWLAQQPKGAVAMLPVNPSGHVRDYVETTVYMLQGLRHRHPLVNGYSGFFPPAADRMVEALRDFPSERSMRALRNGHVRYAVVDRKLGTQPPPGLEPVFSVGPRIVYRVP